MNIDLSRLAKALRMQRSHIDVLLQHPDRDFDNFHLALAGVLRSMLCDRDKSTLLVLAREISMDLRVWGPFPAHATTTRPPDFVFKALTMSATPEFNTHEMSIDEYLDAPIGAISVSRPGETHLSSQWYSPCQLIKWTANKEGPTHFDPKSSAAFQSIGSSIVAIGSVSMISQSGETPITENDNLLQRMALIQIAQSTTVLADQVLAKYVSSMA